MHTGSPGRGPASDIASPYGSLSRLVPLSATVDGASLRVTCRQRTAAERTRELFGCCALSPSQPLPWSPLALSRARCTQALPGRWSRRPPTHGTLRLRWRLPPLLRACRRSPVSRSQDDSALGYGGLVQGGEAEAGQQEEVPVCRNSAAPEMAARTTAAPPTASSPTSRTCTATFTSSVPYPMWTCQHKAREGGGQSRGGRHHMHRLPSMQGLVRGGCPRKSTNIQGMGSTK